MHKIDKALVIAYDVVGPLMAGPGLRSLRLAECIAKVMPVDLMIGAESEPVLSEGVGYVRSPNSGEEANFMGGYSSCLAASTFPLTHPWLLDTDIPLAVDCYDPYVLENLFLYGNSNPGEARFQHERHLKAQIESLMRADCLVCASPRQADLYTGAMMVLNRLNPEVVSDRGALELIKIVPFGIEENDPPLDGGLRGNAPGWGKDDEILLWGGGIWDWFDPLNLIKAINILRENHPNIRLHFLGIKHPNRHIPVSRKAKEAMSLAKETGLSEKHVFFNDWVPADERWKYLRDADLGVSFHLTGFETRFSFRTRLLDYLWTGLPMVLSSGDDLGAEFASEGLGETIDDATPEKIAETVHRWLGKKKDLEIAVRFEMVKTRYRWSRVAASVVQYMKNPFSTKGRRGEEFFDKALGGMNVADRPANLKNVVRRILKGGG